VGTGSRMAHVKQLFTQGDVARTENITDLAISGDGFFVIKTNFGQGYSRDGSMHFNKRGELVTSDDYNLLGYASENGRITTRLEPIKIKGNAMAAQSTTKVDMQMNLNSIDDIREYDPDNPFESSNFAHTVTVYDNIGIPRVVTVLYNKADDNLWEYRVLADSKDTGDGDPNGPPVEMASGRLVFNRFGGLEERIEDYNSFDFNKGAEQGQEIEFSWGKSVVDGGTGLDSTTQFGSVTSITRHSQDGHSAANLSGLSLNKDGMLSALYDNGEIKNIAQVALAKFDNNEGLFKVGQNVFKSSRKSGEPNIGSPGSSGRGVVLSKSLELSNADIAHELVNLLQTQRNYTANAKVLKTSTEMLDEVLKIK
ncbi:MAG: flagellar hook protein FlgE, partial [Halobacteriovoraceae bacterium]|nr:flagellar hook protein FlgE [Halobacteriovoraceae bacterium]